MIVRRSVKHHINVGNFEHIEVGGEVEIDVPPATAELPTTVAGLQRQLDIIVKRDLDRVRAVLPEGLNFDSYIEEWDDGDV